MLNIHPIQCQHIADYYWHKHSKNPSIGNKLLYHGYTQCAMGIIEQRFNNLFSRPILKLSK